MATDSPHMGTAFSQHLGITFDEMAEGQAVCRMAVTDHLTRSQGIVHGGALASLMDCAVGAAAQSVRGEARSVVTVQLNVHFIRPARPGQILTAQGNVQHAGKRTAVVAGKIVDDRDRLIATTTATMMYLDFKYD